MTDDSGAAARTSGRTGDHVVTRFMRKIDPRSIHGNECWLWIGCIQENGYGRFNGEGKPDEAHRVAFRLFIGPIQEGMDVCHSCDVRHCVWPDHLFLGTRLENMRDALAKGRISRGEKHSHALL